MYVKVHFDKDAAGNKIVVEQYGVDDDRIQAHSSPAGSKIFTYGGGGDDTILFSLRDDNLYGGTGNDKISVAFGMDAAFGGAGDDTISSGYGTNRIDGGSGNDLVESSANVDFKKNSPVTPDGSPGANGNDTLAGGSGVDTLSYAKGGAITADLSRHTVQGFTTDTVTGFEKLIGSAYADKITGSSGAETLDGFSGNDVIRGKGGADTLTGGAGADKFVFLKSDVGAGLGVDHITDFGTGRDRIDLRDFFKGHAGAKVGDIVHVTDTAAGLKISALSGGAFVDVAVLDGVHQLSLAALAKDLIIA